MEWEGGRARGVQGSGFGWRLRVFINLLEVFQKPLSEFWKTLSPFQGVKENPLTA